jgi:hypothetical protein
MQRCVKIATKSVHYFRRFEVTDKRTLTFLYIEIIYFYFIFCIRVSVYFYILLYIYIYILCFYYLFVIVFILHFIFYSIKFCYFIMLLENWKEFLIHNRRVLGLPTQRYDPGYIADRLSPSLLSLSQLPAAPCVMQSRHDKAIYTTPCQ